MVDNAVLSPVSGCICWLLLQVRKFRTLTELIMDAEEHVKNPYKGKKLKVSVDSVEGKTHERTSPSESGWLLC